MSSFDPSSLVEIHLVGFPVQVWARAQEHADELIRELTLIAQQVHDDPEAGDVPARLVALVDRLTVEYGSLNTDQEAVLAKAAESGESELPDFVVSVPSEAAQACRDLDAMLDRADAYCRAGRHLLTLTTPSGSLKFRKWYLGEVIRQLAGESPLPWADHTG